MRAAKPPASAPYRRNRLYLCKDDRPEPKEEVQGRGDHEPLHAGRIVENFLAWDSGAAPPLWAS